MSVAQSDTGMHHRIGSIDFGIPFDVVADSGACDGHRRVWLEHGVATLSNRESPAV